MGMFHRIKWEVRSGFFIIFAVSLLVIPFPWVVGWFLAAATHELGHLLAMYLLKVRIYTVRLDCYGAKIETESMIPKTELICSAAGPLLALTLILLCRKFPYLAICAAAQSVFNLLPVYPMDGGRMLHCLCSIILNERISNAVSKCVSFITLLFLGVTGVYLGWKYLGFISLLPCIILVAKRFEGKFPCKVNKQIVK